MNTSEYRKYVRSMDRDKLEACLMELYKREPKKEKEIIELVVTGVNENKEIPGRDAAIPNIKMLRKKLDQFHQTALIAAFWRPYTTKKIRKGLRQILDEILRCPVRSCVRPDAEDLFIDTFLFSMMITYRFSTLDGTIKWWTGMDDETLFRTLCGYILSSGYTRDNLLKTAWASCVLSVGNREIFYPLQEALVLYLKNGDLRIEMMELIEHELTKIFASDDKKSREYATRLSILYLMLCEKEVTILEGLEMLEKICGLPFCQSVYALWNSFSA